jgi:hypothetical protein
MKPSSARRVVAPGNLTETSFKTSSLQSALLERIFARSFWRRFVMFGSMVPRLSDAEVLICVSPLFRDRIDVSR